MPGHHAHNTYLDALKKPGLATYYWGNWEDEPTGQVILAAQNLGSRLLLGCTGGYFTMLRSFGIFRRRQNLEQVPSALLLLE